MSCSNHEIYNIGCNIFKCSKKKLLIEVDDNYKEHIKHFIKWLGTKQLSQSSIIEYFIYLNTKTDFLPATIMIKRSAVKARLRMLRSFYGFNSDFFCNLEQFLHDLDNNTKTRISKPKTNIDSCKILSKEEVFKLITGTRGIRLPLFIRFLWGTGVRVSEMTGIRLSDCDTDGGRAVTIRILGRCRKERFVYIGKDLYDDIRKIFNGSIYLFETSTGKKYFRNFVSNEIARVGRRVLAKQISAHSIRHSFALEHIKNGQNISKISRTLGHSTISITHDMYARDGLSIEEMLCTDKEKTSFNQLIPG